MEKLSGCVYVFTILTCAGFRLIVNETFNFQNALVIVGSCVLWLKLCAMIDKKEEK